MDSSPVAVTETESLICIAQEQVIQTNLTKEKIEKSQEQAKCRMCKRADETIKHIVSECLYDTREDDKEVEKIGRYLKLARELKKM